MLLGVDDEADLISWEERLGRRGEKFATFVEPDIGFKKTALAVVPGANKNTFRGLKLL